MSENLNELFAELKAEIGWLPSVRVIAATELLYEIDELINNGEFARAEQDAYIG